MYPGCIAETNLFREKRQWFKTIFPLFMKYVTGGYVPETEAGQRLAQVIDDPECDKQSGVYWSWNGNAQLVPITTLDSRHAQHAYAHHDAISPHRLGSPRASSISKLVSGNSRCRVRAARAARSSSTSSRA